MSPSRPVPAVDLPTSTPRVDPIPVLVLDLATLRFAWQAERSVLALLSAPGELLAVVDCAPGTTERQGAFAVLEEAAATARLVREGVEYRVAFYNPYTAEVSFDATVANRVFAARTPLTLAAAGAPASITGDTLTLAGRQLSERTDFDATDALRAVAAHQGL